MKNFAIAALLLIPVFAFAQSPENSQKDAEDMKKLQESLDTEIDRLADALDLEDWQVFYLDSIFNYNFTHRAIELKELSKARVSNEDAYYIVDDRWREANYQALQKIFDDKQWAAYLKMGAKQEKKARDKRAAKREEK